MNSRWYNIAVVVLWLSTMSWLVIQKILPSLVVGDPPDRSAILAGQNEDRLVGCEVLWNGEAVGWALIRAESSASGTMTVDGRMHFSRLPIRRFVPEMLETLLGPDDSLPGHLPVDVESKFYFHSNGELMRFASSLALDPGSPIVQIGGFVADENVIVTVRSGGLTYEIRRPLPRKALVGDTLLPQTRLPGLREGRKWTVELYSPFRPPTEPMEIMQAEVVGRETIIWDGKGEKPWLVVYRSDPGSDVGRAGKQRVWLWVRDDGVVLKQRINVLGGTLTFIRMPGRWCRELQQELVREERLPALWGSEQESGVLPDETAERETETEASQP